jgi:3(or 17)beta-hydroxysteroid dehydrogenase
MTACHDGKVVLVTGGASGLGSAIARRFVAEGARVVISDVQEDLGSATADELKASFLQQDVRDEGRWHEIVRLTEGRFGRLDVLINNAGILGPMNAVSPEDTELRVWRDIFAVNVEGVFLGCRAAIPAMRRAGAGAIVNIASIAGLLATPYATAYGASKAAVRQLTKSVAQHCAQQNLNIRCNSVHPGTIRTPLIERYATEVATQRGVSMEEVLADEKASIPQGDFTLAEDVAAAVSFLASAEARHITGAKLIVDGGLVNCSTFSWQHTTVGGTPPSTSTPSGAEPR